jgi:hypothetical protein
MKEPFLKLNRIVIIGNGFDLMNGLDTRYSDFIKDYLYECLTKLFIQKKYNDNFVSINFPTEFKNLATPDFDKNNVLSIINNLEKEKKIVIKHKSHLFGKIYNKLNYGWVDIEREYYSILVKSYNIYILQTDESKRKTFRITKLNEDLRNIKDLLIKHIKKEEEKYNAHDENCDLDKTIEDLNTRDFPQFNIENRKEINQLLLLNFNYTQPKFIINNLQNKTQIINIHGTTSSRDVIFGYGDELDEHYKQIEKDGNDEWLKGFKSFGYLQNNEYNKLLGFIESGPYQVYVVGHSCGLSDKTLLNQLFEHNHCKSIKVFYHKFTDEDRNGEDTFNETIYNISRVMDDKVKLRNIVSKKINSEEIVKFKNSVAVSK